MKNSDVSMNFHPVHIVNADLQTSPSALIPFCEFGGNMASMGTKIEQFDFPVCNSFRAKIRNDQLCYEVDLNRFADKNNIDNELEFGFYFILDYNEDRQITLERISNKKEFGLAGNITEVDHSQHAIIYLNTIGISFKYVDVEYLIRRSSNFRTSCHDWRGRI